MKDQQQERTVLASLPATRPGTRRPNRKRRQRGRDANGIVVSKREAKAARPYVFPETT